jgi:hypothetical protein
MTIDSLPFVEFLVSTDARAILARHGFGLPP